MISSENENIDEIKHRLLYAKLELITTRMTGNAEIKKYQETVKHLCKLLQRVCQERDEARDQLQLLRRNFQASTSAETSSTIPQVDHPNSHAFLHYKTTASMNNTKVSNTSSKSFSNHYDLSLSPPKQPNYQNKVGTIKAEDLSGSGDNMVDSASLVIDKLVGEKPLPQKGRLLQSVKEAGPLLHTLLVAPLPQWQNSPLCLSSSGLPFGGTQDNNSSTNMDDKASVIPTSLSLAFPWNSGEPSQISSVKTEPVSFVDMDSNRMHNHILIGKKRKLL